VLNSQHNYREGGSSPTRQTGHVVFRRFHFSGLHVNHWIFLRGAATTQYVCVVERVKVYISHLSLVVSCLRPGAAVASDGVGGIVDAVFRPTFCRRSQAAFNTRATSSPSLYPADRRQSSRPSRQYLRSRLKVWSTIADLKEIAPGVGWVMLDAHLLWTDRDGAVWWDITPPRPATGDLSTVYALDSRHLWAAALDTPRYSLEVPFTMSLFRTSNGGAHMEQSAV
jgi:hypothetical protein